MGGRIGGFSPRPRRVLASSSLPMVSIYPTRPSASSMFNRAFFGRTAHADISVPRCLDADTSISARTHARTHAPELLHSRDTARALTFPSMLVISVCLWCYQASSPSLYVLCLACPSLPQRTSHSRSPTSCSPSPLTYRWHQDEPRRKVLRAERWIRQVLERWQEPLCSGLYS